MAAYNVVLADDHAMFREGIKEVLQKMEDVLVSGEAKDGLELLELLKASCPDLVILDITMPNLRGLEAIGIIKKTYPQVKVLVLTMHKKKEFIRQAIRDGADGFLLKEDAGSELLLAINTIRKGGMHLSPLLKGALLSLATEKDHTEILTIREREILKLLAEGKKTNEIAEVLYISPFTVRRHRANIMGKLHIKTLADLIKYAISQSYVADCS